MPKEIRALACILAGSLVGLTGMSVLIHLHDRDYQEQVASEAHTCELIAEGKWPIDVAPWCADRIAEVQP